MGRRILVVEDDDLVRRALVAHLEHDGFVTGEAAGGAEGIDKLREDPPDLVLCDLRMPDVDGLGVLEVAAREFPQVPVIMMSGAGVLTDAIGALKLGAWDYLIKPFRAPGVLQHAIERAFERAELLSENDRYRSELESTNRDLRVTLRQLQNDVVAGRQVQFRLLPEDHLRFGSYEFARKLETSAHLSGDFVDYFAIGDGRIGFYLADVAGHGVPSALVTVFLKSFMQQQLKKHAASGDDTILSPKRTVTTLNEEMLREQLGKHVTMFYGVIDTRENRLTYVNAGQFPYPIIRADGAAHYLEERGFPVGLFGFADYAERYITLPERFIMALCSDGILEVIKESTLAARLGYLLDLVETPDFSLEQLCDAICVEGHRPLPDDVTVMVVRRDAA